MCSNGQPLISVAMGVYYRRTDTSLLERSINSILNQSWTNLEFLICENGSSEPAKILLMRIANRDRRIRLLDGSGADTLAEKLNRCIRAAQGKWIARQDDDDVSYPNRLEVQMDYLLSHPQCAFVGCAVDLEQEDQLVGCRLLPEQPTIHDFLFVQPYIHPTLLFRKNVLESVEGYCEDECCEGCEDYDLLLRMYEKGFNGNNLRKIYFSYTIPAQGVRNRSFKMRLNETKTRWRRFASLGLLPRSFPYVVKPILVGVVPPTILSRLKVHFMNRVKYDE